MESKPVDGRRYCGYSHAEKAVINKKLGLPWRAKLPKCPAKNLSFVSRCQKEGDYSHSAMNHFCPECACKYTAGTGTDHYGYGWCFRHSNRKLKKHMAERFALRHLEAIQQRHPSLYHQANAYFMAVEKQGKHASETQTLENEIKLLRATTLELMDRIKKGEATAGRDKLGDALIMTDKDKVAAVKDLTQAIGRLIKTDSDIHNDNVIPLDSFKVWLAALARAIKEEFPGKEDQEKFVNASRKAGEPKRG